MPAPSDHLTKESRHSAGRSVRGRTTGVRIVTRTAFSVFLITACVALGVLSVPQMRKLRALKEELARAKALESHVEQEKHQKRRDLNAIRNDPAATMNFAIGEGVPGPLTAKFIEAYRHLVHNSGTPIEPS